MIGDRELTARDSSGGRAEQCLHRCWLRCAERLSTHLRRFRSRGAAQQRAVRFAALLLIASLSACAPVRLGNAEPRWIRVRTPHFVIYTDLAPRAAQARAELLERYLSAYLDYGWDHHGELPLSLNVVLFADEAEFFAFADASIGGFFAEALFEPWAVLPGTDLEEHLTALRHELSHYLAYMALQYQPAWYSEGIATYFETARFVEGEFLVGGLPPFRYARLLRGGRISAKRLFNDEPKRDASFYASAWLLVHYLLSERDGEFVRYQRGLARGQGHAAAWASAFPDLDLATLDRVLAAYARRDRYLVVAHPAPEAAVASSVERLSRADECALRATLYDVCVRCGATRLERRDESLACALAHDPSHLLANAYRALLLGGGRAEAKAIVERLVAKHSDSWLAWLAYASVSQAEASLDAPFAAISRSVELAPKQPYARMLAAQLHLRAGRFEQALRESERALVLQPTSVPLLVARAEILASLSQCEPLRSTVTAIGVMAHQRVARETIEQLRRLADACRAPALQTSSAP